ncbi:hypothetical protein QBC34DRAFT_476725 [Podospora aff. communis PSN243]|uniref:Uncharacterized protein n=1 Tax=Podospora aff. communis PSN243 TaxID=3040156 RepID=A0AAV9G5C6_9PEZI|nr:hypothetical protein QBC34DRAFT_476725 [Podospora aff. communis PSN243]
MVDPGFPASRLPGFPANFACFEENISGIKRKAPADQNPAKEKHLLAKSNLIAPTMEYPTLPASSYFSTEFYRKLGVAIPSAKRSADGATKHSLTNYTRPRGVINYPRETIVVEDSDEEDNSLGPAAMSCAESSGHNNTPPNMRKFRTGTPVDRCSPPPAPTSPPPERLPLGAPNNWCPCYDTDPGLMVHHYYKWANIMPLIKFEETIILDDEKATELGGTGVERCYSSSLPAKDQVGLVEQSKRHSRERRAPYHPTANYSVGVGARALHAALEAAIEKEEDQRMYGKDMSYNKRGVFDYEKPAPKNVGHRNKRVRFI